MGKIIAMGCPKCKKEATKVDENEYQCLYCGIRFFYDPRATRQSIEWENILFPVFFIVLALGFLVGLPWIMYRSEIIEKREIEKTKRIELQLKIEEAKLAQLNATNKASVVEGEVE